jgi:hypothetical protein
MLSTQDVARRWWAFGLRSLSLVAFALLLVPRLGSAAEDGALGGLSLGQFFGCMAIVGGFATYISAGGRPNWKWHEIKPIDRRHLRMEGAIGLVIGAIALSLPGIPNWGLRLVVAMYSILVGFYMKSYRNNEVFLNRKLARGGLYKFCGGVSIAFGPAFAVFARESVAAWLLLAYTGVVGLCLLSLCWSLFSFYLNSCD